MSYLVKATAIWRNARYVFNDPNNVIDLNSPKIDAFSPRNVWLLRQLVPGQNQVQYLITFAPSSEQIADANTIQGLWVEQDGQGVMIDCISIDNFNSILNSGGDLQRRYGAAPAFTSPTPTGYCITRSDDGSASAHQQVTFDYIGQYIGNVRLQSNLSGVSVYRVSAYAAPTPVGSDVIVEC
ncbi:MAG TPA: hypothetical protein PKI55_04170 [Chitinophagaceae bacterium]|nr:hypothetical protein [Chitinophagaceae bacterium]